jgi:hypothetical protein
MLTIHGGRGCKLPGLLLLLVVLLLLQQLCPQARYLIGHALHFPLSIFLPPHPGRTLHPRLLSQEDVNLEVAQ